jgi:hypothetical protein
MNRLASIGCLLALALGAVAAGLAACGPDETLLDDRATLAVESHDGGANRPPVVVEVQIEPRQPAVGDRLRATAVVRDAEGDPVELSYRWSVDGETMADSGAEFALDGVSKGANVEVRVSANDGFAESDPQTANVWVIDRAPVLEGIAIEPTKSVYPGDSVIVTPTASDPDGDFVDFEFEWFVNDQPADGRGRSFSSEGLSHGDRIRVRVVAVDGRNESRPLESQDVVVGSAHPEIVSNPPGMMEGGVFRYPVEARDPDGDRNLRYRLATRPEGMRIDGVLGVIEWRPREDQVGVHPVAVVVSDSTRLETTQRFEVTVGSAPAAPDDAAQ